MKKALIMTIAMLAILSVSMVPQAFSFCIPPNPASDDSKFEVFGPHINGIRIFVYPTVAAEFVQMGVGQIDIVDWALGSAEADAWDTVNGPITEQNYGGENGYYLLDINNNATMTPDDAVPGIHNPTSDLALRQAIAACCNRSDVVSFTGGFALPMYTMIPPYMGGYINTGIAPGQAYDALTYGGYTGDLDLANDILDAAGYTWSGSVRLDPHTGLPLNLIFYSRSGDRGLFGDHLNVALNAVGIGTTYHSNVPRSEVTGPVFAQEYFNLYTGGWTGIGPDPDYLDDLYGGKNYYHPGSPPNYCNVNFDETNANGTTIKLAPSLEVGLAATLDFQYWFAFYAASVPMWSYTGVKAYKNVPKETSTSMDPVTNPEGDWKHLVNQKAVGVNSWWSTLDMQTYGDLYPNLNAWYGFSSTVTLQNVIYAQWYWDWEVLGRIYDGGWARNPYTLLWGVSQLYKDYTVGTWIDSSAPVGQQIKTSVTVTLRPDVYWQDGQPFTAADVYYTLVEISNDLLAKGFPPPWWYPTVQYMRSVAVIDNYNVEVLLDVQSVWAAGWVIGTLIIPKHIWKPIVDASISPTNNPLVQGTTPDANIIGSGPFRWVSGTGTTVGDTIVMVANTPGSVVNSITSPGYYQYCPIYASITPPGQLSKVNLDPTDSSVDISVDLTLRNLWTDGSLIVNKYVYVYNSTGSGYPGSGIGGLMDGFPIDKTLAPVTPYPMGTSDVETLDLTLPKATLWFIKLAVHVKGPATVTYTEPWDGDDVTYTIPNPWISQWINVTLPIWVTVKEDIAGGASPDLKVDMKDVREAAKAFGSYPGHERWSTVADITGDYKTDMKDIRAIAKLFGWPY